jgi:UDP-N-acetylmuramoyl-tripeptide--D-alanyl-D-alanine ligase
MVELGMRQESENADFAAAAASVATDVVVVGQTNARALVAGSRGGRATVVRVSTREQAVAWVSEHAGTGDVVLYENDLPDHFP